MSMRTADGSRRCVRTSERHCPRLRREQGTLKTSWCAKIRPPGLEETLTVHRLGVGTLLRQTLASSNPIESCLSTVERVARNVKRWRAGNHALRWTATGLLEAERKFRRVKGYRELEILQRKLNPSLTQQEQVA
jgi:hypothetical protein